MKFSSDSVLWFEVERRSNSIRTRPVVSETPAFVTYEYKEWDGHISTIRQAKSSEWSGFYKTFEEAKANLVDIAERKFQVATMELSSAEIKLDKAHNLTEGDSV